MLLERLQFLRQAGITFNGARDLYEILGYTRTISSREYRDRYARGGIAKRIVEALPKATWRGGMDLVEDENPEVSTAFEQTWATLETRLHVHATLERADILAGLSTYSVILIGAPGNLSDELPKGKPESLLYLTPFLGGGGPGIGNRTVSMSTDAMIQSFVTDPTNPRFGLPDFYQLRRIDITAPEFQVPVHWSRVIHIAEGCLEDEVYGTPTLENVYNLLDDLDKVTGGGAEAFWLRANQGLQLDIDPKMGNFSDAEKKDLQSQADEYSNNIRRIIRTRGVTVNPLGSDVANFSNPADAILTQIAGSKGIPKRILTGSEMGELASSQDRENWKDQVNGRQTGYAAPYIIRPLVDRLIQYGYLPTPKQYGVMWPHIQVMTEQEKAAGAAQWAGVNSSFGSLVFTESEIRSHWYDMEPLSEEDEATALSETQRAEGADKWATATKTMGSMVFTPDEIRAKWSDLPPLTDEQKAMPVTAPERVSSTAPTPEQDKNGNPIIPAAVPAITVLPGKKTNVVPFGKVKAAEAAYSFSSTQVNLPETLSVEIQRFVATILDSQLNFEAGGRETDTHVTVKYGIHADSPDAIRQLLSDVGPLTITLGETSFFSASEYDVLYVQVISPSLVTLNHLISQGVEVTDTRPSYTPHVTVAYLQPGFAQNYARNDLFQGRTFICDEVEFSSSNGTSTLIPLTAQSFMAFEGELLSVLEAAITTNNTDVIDAIIGVKHLGGQGSGNFGHSGREGETGGSGTSDLGHIRSGLASLPSGTSITIGPETYSAMGTGSWTSSSGASYSSAAMPVGSLVQGGMLSSENTLTPEQQLAVGADLVSAAKKKALGNPLLALAITAAGDGVSTAWVLNHGGHEQDPLTSWLIGSNPKALAAGAGLEAAGAWAWMHVTKDHPKVQAAGLYILSGVHGTMVMHNVGYKAQPETKPLLSHGRTPRGLGGQGSGNFGHAGRPGAIGGSGEGGASMMNRHPDSFTPMRPAGLDTKERYSDGYGHYTPERTALHEEIISKYMKDATPVEHPTAMILGGGMGAGKTTLVEAEGLATHNVVDINVDKIRGDLPEFKPSAGKSVPTAYTHEEASDISKVLMQRAIEGKHNVTLDGTGNTTLEKLGGKIAVMRSQGHETVAEYVTTSVKEAQARADERGAKTGRFVPPTAMREAHAAVSRIYPEAVRQGLFDRGRVWDTSGPRGSKPVLIASSVGTHLTVHDQGKWDSFLAKGKE